MDMTRIEHSTPDYDLAVRRELAQLLVSAEFAHAPVMIRLLTYLIEQTLAGNGRRLKSYHIAVDGLGRSADFDPATDSYPRVQIGRLRKLLEVYYAHHPDQPDPCLHIPSRSYAVRLSRRDIAYPEIVSHQHGEQHHFTTSTVVVQDSPGPKHEPAFPLSFWLRLTALLTIASMLIIASLWAMNDMGHR